MNRILVEGIPIWAGAILCLPSLFLAQVVEKNITRVLYNREFVKGYSAIIILSQSKLQPDKGCVMRQFKMEQENLQNIKPANIPNLSTGSIIQFEWHSSGGN
ncbi:MAG: hypothetical protein IJ485_06145 [Lachnospiraceae bacterium]|nr:hypothetical protein [Lachnospiraceae bacterium]